ncbi:MAG TPA: hypothetical protein VMT16_07190 [Thermoanaerobaculia bacterium]|nr:hypothetical protein [Thermoanaerobaculia bacterium]
MQLFGALASVRDAVRRRRAARPRSRPAAPASGPSAPRAADVDPRLRWGAGVGGRVSERQASRLLHRLDALLDGELARLTLTDNRSSFLHARRDHGGGLQLRLHWVFAGTEPAVLRAVADFAAGALPPARRRETLATLRAAFDRRPRDGRSARPAPRRHLVPAGRAHDLAAITETLNRRHFADALRVAITWGAWPARRRRGARRTIRLGSFVADQALIRIHPALDQRWVPRQVVESVVHHEMLHAALPATAARNGRRALHPPEFRRREREFPGHAEAEAWIRAHLPRLLRSRPPRRRS